MKKLSYLIIALGLFFSLLGCGGGGGGSSTGKDADDIVDIYKKVDGRYKTACIKDDSNSYKEYIILKDDKNGEIRRASFNGEACANYKINNWVRYKITYELKNEIEENIYEADIKFDSGEMFYTVIKIEENNITVAFENSDQDGSSQEDRVTTFENSEVLNKINRSDIAQQLKEDLEGEYKSQCITDAFDKSHYENVAVFEDEVGIFTISKFNSGDCSGLGSITDKTFFVYKIGNLIKDINNEDVYEIDVTYQNRDTYYTILKYSDNKLYIAKENGANDGSSEDKRANDITNSDIYNKRE
jgi:hypothetical protein